MHRIIDIQSHFLPEKWLDELSERNRYPYLEKKVDSWLLYGSSHERLPYLPGGSGVDIRSKLMEMDESGIELSLLSLSLPGPDNAGADSDRLARIGNDGIAEVVAAFPDRFKGIANLGLWSVEESVSELIRCVDVLGFVGLQVFPFAGGGKPIVDPSFKPLWEVLENRGVPLIFHPGSPANSDYGNYFIGGLMGYWFDDAMAVAKFILSGLMDEFPNLKVICPHTWSLLPYLIDRLDFQVSRFAGQFPDIRCARTPGEYLNRIYTDCNNFSSADLAYAGRKIKGVSRMMFGSDSPFIPARFIVDTVERSGFSSEEMDRIYTKTALDFFGISL